MTEIKVTFIRLCRCDRSTLAQTGNCKVNKTTFHFNAKTSTGSFKSLMSVLLKFNLKYKCRQVKLFSIYNR